MAEEKTYRDEPGRNDEAQRGKSEHPVPSGEQKRELPQWLRVVPLALLLIAFIAALIFLLRPKPKFTIDCTPEQSASQTGDQSTTPYLLDKQVIITGPPDAVEAVSETVDIPLKPLKTCTLNYLGTADLAIRSFPFPANKFQQVTMGLYAITGSESVDQVVEKINEAGADSYVFADPNYLIGLLGRSTCGRPHTPAGSPHTPAGSPFEIVGSPHTPAGSPHTPAGSPIGISSPAANQLFWSQWAFQHVGAGPSLTGLLDDASITPTGKGVRVAVLDTSPFEDGIQLVNWVSPTLTLEASHLEQPPLTATDIISPDIRDHGLFVASLIHGVAPESEIHLIRVLDEHGCGRLFTLNEALFRVIEQMEEDRCTLDGLVINMSLGIHQPTTDRLAPEPEAQEALEIRIDESLTVLVEDRIESLQAAVLLAYGRGAVVVAAAGNDSYVQGEPLPPQLPAGYPTVIGAAATNIYRERACFSNWGDVSAPGGEGGPNEDLVREYPDELEGIDCLPRTAPCTDDCSDLVIGVVSKSDAFPTGYAYWTGTSFSAPLVSGLAALTLDAGTSRSTWVSPDRVFRAIRCGTPTGDGVINVPATLFRCLPEAR
jgi:hypothetical protein